MSVVSYQCIWLIAVSTILIQCLVEELVETDASGFWVFSFYVMVKGLQGFVAIRCVVVAYA